jgi:NAD(P)-dependent dehydrogenase (short-subunit alcohol dehydrogenase family)
VARGITAIAEPTVQERSMPAAVSPRTPISDATAATLPEVPRRGRLTGKVALVTGGNSGIGLATAQAFVAEGARVAICGRDQATLDAAAATLGADALAMETDVADSAALDRLMAAVAARFGRLDVLFVNAGVGQFAAIEQASEAHFDYIFAVNVRGAYFTVQKALPLLAPGASIVFTGSINGSVGMAGASVYSASKAAVRSLARTLSADLKDRGIRVNVLSPGPVVTPIYERLGLPPEMLATTTERIRAQVPLGRFGDPREIAQAAVFLASDESTFFVGAELVADGGMSQL